MQMIKVFIGIMVNAANASMPNILKLLLMISRCNKWNLYRAQARTQAQYTREINKTEIQSKTSQKKRKIRRNFLTLNNFNVFRLFIANLTLFSRSLHLIRLKKMQKIQKVT